MTTFGCQMNAHDSERIKGHARGARARRGREPRTADVVVFNTCTIREKPDTKLAAYLGDASARKRRDPERVIAVGGCYAEAQRERIFELYPEVDVAFGPGSIAHLGDWLGRGRASGVARGRFGLDERAFAAALPMHRERPFQAWVQVSMGCNSVCSYCIVPAVRGRERSRRPGRGGRRGDAARRARASARSRCSARTSTPTAATSPRSSRPSSVSFCAPATRSRASSGSASRARTRRTSASR